MKDNSQPINIYERAMRPFEPKQPNEYGSEWLGPVRYGPDGWPYLLFTDYYDHKCWLKPSSLAHCNKPGASAIWIGSLDGGDMHLVRGQVQTLVDALTYWLTTGELPERGTE